MKNLHFVMTYDPNTPFRYEQIKQVAKAELHLHFRGCLTPQLLHNMMLPLKQNSPAHYDHLLHRFPKPAREMIISSQQVAQFLNEWCRLQDHEELEQLCLHHFNFSAPNDFFMTYLMTAGLWQEPEELYPLAHHVVHYLETHHIIHAEIIVSVTEYLMCGWSTEQISRLLDYTKMRAAEKNIQILWIFDFVRNFPEAQGIKNLERLLEANINSWVGITLGGDEAHYPARNFQTLYQLARQNNLRLTCHAGEHDSYQSVVDAVLLLQAERIGHGITASHHLKTMELLKQRGVTLEVCPTSNVKTLACSWPEHPARHLLTNGITLSIASDDPGFFQTSLSKELDLCMTRLDFTQDEIIKTLKQGFISSFATDESKEMMIRRFDQSLAQLSQ
ncbi:MAG: hypothetical protein OXC40_04340 [Proteobacteria bacterium]|nr:hypothetical protein [Pseudomonadota bacterium]